MKYCFFLPFFVFFLSFLTWGQDERYFRDFLNNDKPIHNDALSKVSWEVGPLIYKLDLDDDKKNEEIHFFKRDLSDVFLLKKSTGEIIFETTFRPMGKGSKLYKFAVKDLSPNLRVLLLYYYEGHTNRYDLHGSASLFLIAIERLNLSNLKLYSAPALFQEKTFYKEGHFERIYQVSYNDLDGNGTKEIIISHSKIKTILKYKKDGEFEAFY